MPTSEEAETSCLPSERHEDTVEVRILLEPQILSQRGVTFAAAGCVAAPAGRPSLRRMYMLAELTNSC